jgi:hypothetical protein
VAQATTATSKGLRQELKEGAVVASDCSAHRSGTSRVTTRAVVSTSTPQHTTVAAVGYQQEGIPPDSHATGRIPRHVPLQLKRCELYKSHRLQEADQRAEYSQYSDRVKIDCTTKRSSVLLYSKHHKSDCKYCSSASQEFHRECNKNCSLPPDRLPVRIYYESHTDRQYISIGLPHRIKPATD